MKILIIEDDPMVRLINHRFLERISALKMAEIVESDSAVSALQQSELPAYDLILLDMFLPQVSGTEFLAELTKRQLHPQVIMMTAANDQQTLHEAVNYGVLDFLIKPFTFERFNQAIKKFLRIISVDQQPTVSQQDLDSLFLGEETVTNQSQELPKGLSKLSLQRILATLDELVSDFSNQDVANKTGLSRVSTKKYLDFLVQVGFLKSEVVYHGNGRPLTKFYPDKAQRQSITGYL